MSAILPDTLLMVNMTPSWQAASGLGGTAGWKEHSRWDVASRLLAEMPRSHACGVVTKGSGFCLGHGAAQPPREHCHVTSIPHTWVVTWVGGVREQPLNICVRLLLKKPA